MFIVQFKSTLINFSLKANFVIVSFNPYSAEFLKIY